MLLGDEDRAVSLAVERQLLAVREQRIAEREAPSILAPGSIRHAIARVTSVGLGGQHVSAGFQHRRESAAQIGVSMVVDDEVLGFVVAHETAPLINAVLIHHRQHHAAAGTGSQLTTPDIDTAVRQRTCKYNTTITADRDLLAHLLARLSITVTPDVTPVTSREANEKHIVGTIAANGPTSKIDHTLVVAGHDHIAIRCNRHSACHLIEPIPETLLPDHTTFGIQLHHERIP